VAPFQVPRRRGHRRQVEAWSDAPDDLSVEGRALRAQVKRVSVQASPSVSPRIELRGYDGGSVYGDVVRQVRVRPSHEDVDAAPAFRGESRHLSSGVDSGVRPACHRHPYRFAC
jgi:hypothetical protein